MDYPSARCGEIRGNSYDVQDLLKFESAPYLGKLKDLMPLVGGTPRKVFLSEMKQLVNIKLKRHLFRRKLPVQEGFVFLHRLGGSDRRTGLHPTF
jgi:hypothetical protein